MNRTALPRSQRRRCWCGRPVARDVPDPIECAEHDDGPPLPRHLSPRLPTVAQRATRLRCSPLAAHLRASTRSTFWPAVAGSGLLLFVVLVNVLAAGGFATWDGFQPIPAEAGAR